jgi:hypothetical protein
MRNVLALIGLLVIGFGGLGWYLGWYKLSYSRTPDGHLQVTTDVDTKKVGADSQEFIKNASTVVEKAAQDAKTPAGAPGSTPGPVVLPQGSTTPPIPVVPVAPVAPEMPTTIPIPALPTATTPQNPQGPIPLIPPK